MKKTSTSCETRWKQFSVRPLRI